MCVLQMSAIIPQIKPYICNNVDVWWKCWILNNTKVKLQKVRKSSQIAISDQMQRFNSWMLDDSQCQPPHLFIMPRLQGIYNVLVPRQKLTHQVSRFQLPKRPRGVSADELIKTPKSSSVQLWGQVLEWLNSDSTV